MRSLILFVSVGLAFGAAVLGLGYSAGGDEILLEGAVGFGLAFVPASIALGWVIYSCQAAPEMQLMASLGGSGVRLAVALGGGLLLTRSLPQYFGNALWIWLLLFYLALLAFEITLLVRGQPTVDGPPQG
ncbi:MAG: hypothetical protein FJ303_10260 [Planctomycetes bacterium]|nr:hypothetical protein [Planctomycetota bacterium]